jgi:cytochrome c
MTRAWAVLAAGVAAGCGTTGGSATAGAPGPRDGAHVHGASAALAAYDLALGEATYRAVCSACHTIDAPPSAAPPMSHVARHYRDAIPDTDAAVARIAAFVRDPAAERSVLPAHAVERWGLMPPLDLPEEQLRAVAAYVLSLPEDAGMDRQPHGGGHRHGHGHRRRGGHRR